jgi:hypothetical protein
MVSVGLFMSEPHSQQHQHGCPPQKALHAFKDSYRPAPPIKVSYDLSRWLRDLRFETDQPVPNALPPLLLIHMWLCASR